MAKPRGQILVWEGIQALHEYACVSREDSYALTSGAAGLRMTSSELLFMELFMYGT